MADGSKSNYVIPIIVALIGALSTISVALINNLSKKEDAAEKTAAIENVVDTKKEASVVEAAQIHEPSGEIAEEHKEVEPLTTVSDLTTTTWLASHMPHGCGRLEDDIHITYSTDDCWDGEGVIGFSTYGPYVPLDPGNYLITWEIALVKDYPTNEAVSMLEVQDITANKLAAQEFLYYQSFESAGSGEFKRISLNFYVDEEQRGNAFEFRVAHYGTATIKLKKIALKML